MDVKELARLIRKNWMVLISVALVGIGGAALYAITAEKQYTATTTMFVSVKSIAGDSANEVVQGSSAAQLKVKSYVEVIRSPAVLGPVITELQLDGTPAQLARRVTTVVPQNTVTLKVSVVDADPTTAAAIANAVSDATSAAIASIEKSEAGGPSPVSIQTIEPATVPVAPSSPATRPSPSAVAMFGLLGGFMLVLLRERLDTRIHGRADLETLTTVPVIGSISYDAKSAERPLVVRDDARSPRAESFRALRTNLQFLDPTNPDRSFVITSALPSEGKTTTSANLAIAIAESGASVVLVDADLRRPRIADVLGVEGAAGLTDVLVGRAELDDVLQPWGRHELAVLPSGAVPPNPSELLGSAGMQTILGELSTRFQYVIIDAPPLLPVTDAAILSRFVRGALLVTSVKRSRRAQLRAALDSLRQIDRTPLGVILTMLPEKGPDGYGYGAYDRYYGTDAELHELRPSAGRRRGAAPDGPTAADPTA